MRTEDIRNMAKAYAAVLEKLKQEDKLDPVDPKELKGKHKDRKDKDIDNDGDVDSTDKYLHKRRKAVSKSIKKDNDSDTDVQTQETTEATKVECPKCEGKGCDHCDNKGYHIKEATNNIDEASKGTAQHKPDEKTRDTWEKQLSTRKGEKDFKDQHKVETPEAGDEPKVNALNFQKFKSMVAKKDNSRPADQKKGDNNIIPSATPVKGA